MLKLEQYISQPERTNASASKTREYFSNLFLRRDGEFKVTRFLKRGKVGCSRPGIMSKKLSGLYSVKETQYSKQLTQS